MDHIEFAKLGGKARWADKSDLDKKEHAMRMVLARKRNKQASGEKDGDKSVSIEEQPVEEITYEKLLD